MTYKQQIIIYFSIIGIVVLAGFAVLGVYLITSSSNNFNAKSSAKTIQNDFEYSSLIENVNIAEFGQDDLSLESLGIGEGASIDSSSLGDIESTFAQTVKNIESLNINSFSPSDLENF